MSQPRIPVTRYRLTLSLIVLATLSEGSVVAAPVQNREQKEASRKTSFTTGNKPLAIKPVDEAAGKLAPEAAKRLVEGDAALRQGDMTLAARGYLLAVLVNPRDPMTRLAAGVALADLGRGADSLAQFRKAVEYAEDDVIANLLLQNALTESGSVSEAQMLNQDIYRRFGRSQGGGLDASTSIARLREMLRRHPDSPLFALLMGDAYQLSELWDKADNSYRRAIALAPNWSKPRVNLGLSRLAQGKTSEAITQFEQALNHDPKNVQARLWKSDAELKAGKNAQAIRTLAPLMTYQVTSHQIDANSARSNIVNNGIGYVTGAGVVKPVDKVKGPSVIAQAYANVGRAFANSRDFDKAALNLNRAQELAPNDPTPSALLGDIRLQNGEYAAAADSYSTALNLVRDGGLFARRPFLYRSLAEAQLSARRPEQARRTLESALRDEPGSSALWHRLNAQAFAAQGEIEKARGELKAALYAESGPYPLDALRAADAQGALPWLQEECKSDMTAAETGFRNRQTVNGGVSVSSVPKEERTPQLRIQALMALAHIARYQNAPAFEVAYRMQLIQARSDARMPLSAWDYFLMAETYDQRLLEPINARASYSRALEIGGLSDGATRWARQRLEKLTASSFKPK